MKKLVLLILMPFILGILNVSAQSELNDFEGETTESQKTRTALLFELFPELQKAYSLTHSLRMIFSNKSATKDSARLSFNDWIQKVKDFGDKNFCSVASTIVDRQGDEILNYFINRATNASAESLNAKIKLFRAQLHGVVNVKFFLFRVTNIYA